MTNQKHVWDSLHKKGNVDHYTENPTSFAEAVAALLKKKSTILELGCGVGNDVKPQGLACFICKSVNDALYGKGKQLEKDMFDLDGHVRHFFSQAYAKECLGNQFRVLEMTSGQEKFYGDQSAYIKIFAEKL